MLVASALALASGLLAAGPLLIAATPAGLAGQGSLWGMDGLGYAMSCLPLGLAAAWGAVGLPHAVAWPVALRRPLAGFFGLSMAWSLLAFGHHLSPSWAGALALNVLTAAASVLLLLSFLTERLGLVFGSRRACAAGVLAAAGAGALAWVSEGDVRALVWLQSLPAAVVFTGVLGQSGLFTRVSDWVLMLAVYLVALACGGMHGTVSSMSDALLNGHVVMHLVGAGVPAVLAWRLYRASRSAADSVPLSMSSHRVSSFHTAG